MLRNRGIRTKLLAVLALPIVALMIGAAIISTQAFSRASQAAKVEQLAKGADGLATLVAVLHQERTAALRSLADPSAKPDFAKAQALTDRVLNANTEFTDTLDFAALSDQAAVALKATTTSHDKLPALRALVNKGFTSSTDVQQQYTAIINDDLALPKRIGDSLNDRKIGQTLAAFSELSQVLEFGTQEAEVGAQAIAAGGLDAATATDMLSLASAQNQAILAFRDSAPEREAKRMDDAIYLPIDERSAFSNARDDLIGTASGLKLGVTVPEWTKVSTSRLQGIQSVVKPLAKAAGQEASLSAANARRQAVLLLGGSLGVVLLLVGLGLVLARAITRPLRLLTATAGELASELPKMVERMATPGEGPDVQLPAIEVRSSDEVGQLARAFKNVNDTTIRVAEEQAALRASIAEMFVNVARRNHVLLSRQLSFIDQLERTEENPDTLDNLFKLDHLATRMRRNAESLIVLAGIDAGRRLRRAMPLSDVIRTAVSEIERYDRVDLALQADPPMVGHVALTTAHMIAELLENATQFSNPDTRVIAATAFSSTGVRITITDLGLGMTWDEITEANQRIANPPMTDVVGSQRLGFYVVGRLARRLDVTVSLRPGRTQGTVVTIDLPLALFVPGSVAELPKPEVTPADASKPEGTDSESGKSVTAAITDAGGAHRAGHPAPAPLAARGPVLPVLPTVPVAPPTPVADSSAPVALVRRPDDADSDGPTLPKRSRGAAPVPVLPEPAPVAVIPAEPRSGIFGSFRSRRAVEEKAEAPAPAAPYSMPALDAPLEDSEEVYVPVMQESDALPVRDITPTPAAAVVEEARVEEVAPLEQIEAVEQITALDQQSVVEDDDVPYSPQLDVDPASSLNTAPVEPVVEAEPVAEPEPVAVAEPVAEAVVETPLPTRGEARAALADLARESASAEVVEPVVDPASETEIEPVAEAEPETTFPVLGVPAMDILPSRSNRSRRGRKPGKDGAPSQPVMSPSLSPIPAARRPMDSQPATPSVRQEAPSEPAVPVAQQSQSTFAPPAWSAPAPAQDIALSPLFAPAPAPTSAPESESEPLPSELFAPVPRASVEAAEAADPVVQPAFPSDPGPAMAAAVSLRERSAMASEALSELSALSSYAPEAVEAAAPVSLTRRTPLASPAGQLAATTPEEPIGARRTNRNAADVRSMLSGFRAGVERGRTSPASHTPKGEHPEE